MNFELGTSSKLAPAGEFWAEQARKALEEKGISCVKKQ